MNNKNNRLKALQGFTLSELLVVIIVVAVLSAIAVPVYTKSMKRSRASDALKVLSVASAKQEAYFIDNGEYAKNFGELSAPIKGLSGDDNSTVGKFNYTISGSCMAANPVDVKEKYTIYKNFQTQQDGCVGDGCTVLMDLIPTMGAVGCDLKAFGNNDGNTLNDDFCAKNPGLCGTSEPGISGTSCSAGKVKNPVTGECVCSTICSYGGTQNPSTCACSCPSTCEVEGQVMDKSNCSCKCPTDKPYVYDGKCNSCRQGSVMNTEGGCCPDNYCFDATSGICRPDNTSCEGATKQKQTCGGGAGVQERIMQNGCPSAWGAWGECTCLEGYDMDNGVCVKKGECTPGATEDCGNCGKKTCDTNGQWGVCEGEGVCKVGDTRTCGNNDSGTQLCSSSCAWETTCTGALTCKVGQVQKKTCSINVKSQQTRSFTINCSWTEWSPSSC